MNNIDSFDGETFCPERDEQRLTSLMERVYTFMADGEWRTLSEISRACRGSEASVSARLRDLRKEKFADKYPNHGVERARVSVGLYNYRVLMNEQG